MRLFRFLKEVKAELKKVSWPTWDEISRSTIVVFVTLIFFTMFIYYSDYVIKIIVDKVLG